MKNKWLCFGLVLLSVFACFALDLRNNLLDWDDKGYIINNVYIRSLSLDTVVWAFSDFYCNYWAPLTWLSLALDYAVWGINPVGYHLTNNLIHGLNAGLFFLIAHYLLEQHSTENTDATVRDSSDILLTAVLAALFFGIHPLRVESVAWATERKDVLSAFWGFGSVYLYLRYARASVASKDSIPCYQFPLFWAVLMLYALSLLSKAMLVTLPFALLVLDWYPLQRFKRQNITAVILEKLPMVAMAIATSLVTIRALSLTSRPLTEINITTRVLIACKAILQYLQLLLFPVNISPVYFHPGNVPLDAGSAFAITVVTAITIACLLTAKRYPAMLAGWLFFLITISPVLGLTQNGPQELAPRFTYIPTLSLSLLFALGTILAGRKIPVLRNHSAIIPIGVSLLLTCFVALTWRDIGNWKNDITLWTRVIEIQPHKFGKAYFQRSLFLNLAGEYQLALADLDEALAIAEQKKYGAIHEIYAQRAQIHKHRKDYRAAAADLDRAIELSGEPYSSMYRDERMKLGQKSENPAAPQ